MKIGSCTKWMTATLAARLVDRGVLKWDSRIRDILPAAATFHPAYAEATLRQILAHRAGIESGAQWETKHRRDLLRQSGTPAEIRAWVVESALRAEPEVAPGTYLYSNQGYTVAAAMMEKATGKPWEDLMREEVFGPLQMTTARLGCTSGPEETLPTGVAGHDLPNREGLAVPRRGPSPIYLRQYGASNAPGGYVVCTLRDWIRFLKVHAQGAKDYLQPSTAPLLTAAFTGGEGYGLGVNVAPRGWATPGPALTHNGDIFGEDSLFWMSPGRDFIVVLFTNTATADNSHWKGLDEIAGRLIKRYGGNAP